MASTKEEPEAAECESDSDDLASRWAMRRREASSEEDRSSEGEDWLMRTHRRARIGFDDELNGLGRAPVEEDDEEEEFYIEEDREAQLVERGPFGGGGEHEDEEEEKCEVARIAEALIKQRSEEEDKDEMERQALAVPRFGAFYMHDDRFEARRRHPRRRNLKEFKDEGKWQHDKFEDLSRQKSDNEIFNVGRNFEGYHQWYSKNQGTGNCYVDRNHFNPKANYYNGRHTSRIVGRRKPTKSGKHSEFTSYADPERVLSQASASNVNSAFNRLQSMTYSNAEMSSTKGKAVADTVDGSMLYANKLVHPVAKNHLTDFPLQSSFTLPKYVAKPPKLRHQEKHLPLSGPCACQSTKSSSHTFQLPSVPNLRKDSFAGSTKSEIALARVENYIDQADRRSSLSGETYAQRKTCVTPQLLPVKTTEGQYHVDLGVQAVNRVLTGHVVQSHLGFANSGMYQPSVLPITAGGLSAASYPPCISLSNDYYVHALGQVPPFSVSGEVAVGKPMNDSQAPHRTVVNDGFGIGRIKPQRQVDSLLMSRPIRLDLCFISVSPMQIFSDEHNSEVNK